VASATPIWVSTWFRSAAEVSIALLDLVVLGGLARPGGHHRASDRLRSASSEFIRCAVLATFCWAAAISPKVTLISDI